MRRNIHYKPSKSASILSGIIACAMGVFGLFAIPSIGAMIGFKAIWCLMTFGMGIYNFLLAAGVVKYNGGYEITDESDDGAKGGKSDELIKKATRTAEDLDALRGQTEKKRPSPTEIKALHKQHRADEWERNEQRHADERAHSEKRWEIARRKQADSGEVHSVHMDSCEDRLESLKVLYDAGILDREEYAQRVARVKKAHAQSRG